MLHHKGAISATFTSDWYLREGESRDKLGESKRQQKRQQYDLLRPEKTASDDNTQFSNRLGCPIDKNQLSITS